MVYKGSKAKMAFQIAPVLQSIISEKRPKAYCEPFVGGANMITEVSHPVRYGTDINPHLIEFLKLAQKEPDLKWCPDGITKEFYKEVREDFRSGGGKFSVRTQLAVGWLASYGGRFYDGGYGGNGNSPNRTIPDERKRNLLEHAKRFGGIFFGTQDFRDYKPDKCENFLFYCDPPYKDTKQYGNIKFPFDEFREWCRQMGRNNWVVVSEFDMPDDFKVIKEFPRTQTVRSDRTCGQKVTEKLYYVGKDGFEYEKQGELI